jgi:alkanesulfonate monooxygenase SsuD/methylene tetrahydromethanopterin reductase-like flavin-dependent oxidoreductase (luciferase family)
MAQTIESFVGTALDDARMSPIHWRVFALIAAGYFFDVADYVILGALIPDMVRSGFATPAQIATVASATLFGLFIGTLAQGEFTDRFGRKTVYQFNLLLYGSATIVAAFSPNYIWLAALRFIAGIGLGAEQPLCFAYAGEYAPKNIRGRFIAGFVRGIGAEYHAMGINPAQSQDRFSEAHDLIVRAWTEPGPFAYEGKHYHFNYVNPWPRPWQKPHPPIWIPSQGSGSTIKWAAAMRYTYCQTLSPIADVARFFQLYRDEAEKAGYEASPDQLAWSNTIYVADTDEKAMREARPHLEALVNRLLKMPTEMLLPPGYTNIESMKRVRASKVTGKTKSIEELVNTGVVIVGSPNTVREKLAEYQDLAGFNTSLTKTQFGTLPNEMTRANMVAIAEEIIPHFRTRLPQGKRQAAAE